MAGVGCRRQAAGGSRAVAVGVLRGSRGNDSCFGTEPRRHLFDSHTHNLRSRSLSPESRKTWYSTLRSDQETTSSTCEGRLAVGRVSGNHSSVDPADQIGISQNRPVPPEERIPNHRFIACANPSSAAMSMKRELPQVGGFARQLPVTQSPSQRPARKVEGGPRDSAEGDQVTVETTDRVYWTYCQRKWPSNSPEHSADRRSPSFPNTNQLRG